MYNKKTTARTIALDLLRAVELNDAYANLLLPKLLATGRAHAATSPIPEGWVSVLDIFPAHPMRTPMLVPRAFDTARHAAFQALLARYGLPEMLAAKDAARREAKAELAQLRQSESDLRARDKSDPGKDWGAFADQQADRAAEDHGA